VHLQPYRRLLFQTLLGGSYALLNLPERRANPDFWAALLWRRLMGSTLLSAWLVPPVGKQPLASVRVYAACSAAETGALHLSLYETCFRFKALLWEFGLTLSAWLVPPVGKQPLASVRAYAACSAAETGALHVGLYTILQLPIVYVSIYSILPMPIVYAA